MSTWIFPRDVAGWLTETEGAALSRLAENKAVFEIGSYCGKSSICIAQTAKHLYCVDPFDGRGTPEPRECFGDFLANITRYGVRDKITYYRATSSETELPCKVDLAFIDGAHDARSVSNDVTHAIRHLNSGGLLAFHDYNRHSKGGVTATVNKLIEAGGKAVSQHESVLVLDPPSLDAWHRVMGGWLSRIYVAFPARPHGNISFPISSHTTGCPECIFDFRGRGLSLLTTNFNWLLCDAMNARDHGATHFVMHHDDLDPEPGWLRVLLEELKRTGADILSCVIAIKDIRGLSSTGVMDWKTRRMRKFSIAETLKLPKSFTAEEAGYPEHALLMNSGLWICKLTEPWIEKMVFRQHDSIVRQANGKFRPVSVSEDWLFSLDAHRLGLKCMATTAVKIKHWGGFEYANYAPWGTDMEGEQDSAGCYAWDVNAPESWGLPRDPVGVPCEG